MNRRDRRKQEKLQRKSGAGQGAALAKAVAAPGLFPSQMGAATPGRFAPAGTEAGGLSEATLQQASALRQAGRTGEALALCQRGLARDGEDAGLLSLAGAIYWSRNDLNQALPLLRKATQLKPNDAEVLTNYGAVLQSLGKLEEAMAHHRRALKARPGYGKAQGNLGAALLQGGSHEEAAKVFRRALDGAPRFAEAAAGLGVALQRLGRLDEAGAAQAKAIELDPENAGYRYNLAATRLAQGAPAEALEILEGALAREPGEMRKLAFKTGLLAECRKQDQLEVLLDFDRLIAAVPLAVPPGYADIEAFNGDLADHLRAHRSLQFEPPTKATRKGWQSGEVLSKPEGPLVALRGGLEAAIRDYLAAHPRDPAHPFLARRPSAWRLKGWATVLESEVHQTTHIHPTGWLSGVYYPALPGALRDGEDGEAGWIEFGRPGTDFPLTAVPRVHSLRPREGLLVLFPSYFYHRTLPFSSDEPRVSFAFDVIPETWESPDSCENNKAGP